MLCTPSWSAWRFHFPIYDIATYDIFPAIVRLFYDFSVVVVILFYQSFTVTDIVTLFYENVLLYSHIVKLNYHQTPVLLQLYLIKSLKKLQLYLIITIILQSKASPPIHLNTKKDATAFSLFASFHFSLFNFLVTTYFYKLFNMNCIFSMLK